MNIEETVINGVIVLKLSGRLTMEKLALLDETAKKYISNGSTRIVLNMTNVADMSSSGIAKIVDLSRIAVAKGGKVVLSELSSVCKYVLELTNLYDSFPHCPTDEEAIELARQSAAGD